MAEELAMQNLNCLYPHISEEHKQAIDKAIKALKKQIPKKPKRDITEAAPCPVCGFSVIEKIENFCPHCGQALDWRDEE